MTRVEIQDLSVRYGALRAVRDVSLDIEPGEVFFLLGPSGCGKTTLLRAIAGLHLPAAGEILFNGRPMNMVPAHRRNVGFVFQNYALWPHLTVAENVAYGLVTRKVEAAARDARVKTTLAMLGLGGLEDRAPGELSGGQQQRVAVARAVVIEPDVLLMDEPLSNLDARLRAEMRRELKALVRRLGVTTIYVTHDQREALSMADRVAVMNDGAVAQVARPEELYYYPQDEFVASFVGETNVLAGTVARVARDGFFEVTTPAKRFKVLATGTLQDIEKGDSVRLLVRPEDIAVGRGLEGDNVLEAKVVDLSFLGGLLEVQLELHGAVCVRALHHLAPGEVLEPGESVDIAVRADRVRLFKSGED